MSQGRKKSKDSKLKADYSYKFWSTNLDRHYLGDYSFAAIKGKSIIEDYSQVLVGPENTFVGVYDGHGGYQTSEYLSNHMFNNLMSCIKERSTMSEEALKEAFMKTDADWVAKVLEESKGQELIAAASSGSSCLVGMLWKKSLYIANVGNTRAIMVQRAEDSTETNIHPLTRDDDVKYPDVRAEVQALHPDEPDFVVEDANTRGVYLIKGKSELSKSIGDVHLKYTELNLLGNKVFLSSDNPAVTSVPSVVELPIQPFNGEKFIIFASRGFWELMGINDAAEIAIALPWKGIAAVLIKQALLKAATKTGKSYEDVLRTKDSRGMKLYHNDITVVVLFFKKNLDVSWDIQEQLSVKVGGSYFSVLEKIRQS